MRCSFNDAEDRPKPEKSEGFKKKEKQIKIIFNMITLAEIQQHFDDVTVKDGDMGEYAEIRVFPGTYVNVYLSTESRHKPELYRNQTLVCLLSGVNTIEDLKTLHRLIMS